MSTATLITDIADAVSHQDRETYHRLILANLDVLAKPARIASEGQYALARAMKTALCSVSCTTSNTNHPDDARVWEIEASWAKVLHAFNNRLLIKDSDTRLLANYLIWNRRLRNVDERSLIELAAERGILRLREGKVYVVGLYKKVGNNVFTVDAKGREHRQFMNTIGRQAFSVRWDGYHEAAKLLLDLIPQLPDDYDVTGCYDGKYGARNPSLTATHRSRVLELVRQWESARSASRNIMVKITGTPLQFAKRLPVQGLTR